MQESTAVSKTSIEWTDYSWNPWTGCTKVADGCKHCYAEEIAHRFHRAEWGPKGTRTVASEAMWAEPLKWNRQAQRDGVRRRVFCASMGDVFEEWDGPMISASRERLWNNEDVPRYLTMADVRRHLFELIDATPHLDWLLLTKRPQNMFRMWRTVKCYKGSESRNSGAYRDNVWLGCSVSHQDDADRDLPHLLQCRYLCRLVFVSAEPLVGALRLQHEFDGALTRNWLGAGGLDWVIVGGESGRNARPCDVTWIRSIVRQCSDAGVPCFVKQLGSLSYMRASTYNVLRVPATTAIRADGDRDYLCLADKKGGDPAEWPADLRVRWWPEATGEALHEVVDG